MDRDELTSSLTQSTESNLEATSTTNSQICKSTNCKKVYPDIIEEFGHPNKAEYQYKHVTRRNSADVSRNGVLKARLRDKDYSAKILKHLHLKGHVKYLKKEDVVLFVCSPM